MTSREIALQIIEKCTFIHCDEITKELCNFEDEITAALIRYGKQEREKALREAAEIIENLGLIDDFYIQIDSEVAKNKVLSLVDKEPQ